MNKDALYKKIIKDIPQNIIIMTILILLTMKFVFAGLNMDKIVKAVKNIDMKYLSFAILLSALYLVLESVNTKNILHLFGYRLKIKNALRYAVIGFFFSSITPSATGGQPMQVYFMKKDDILISNSIITLMLEFVAFQIVTVTLAIIGLFTNFNYVLNSDSAISYIIYTGIILNILIMLIAIFAMFSRRFTNFIRIVGKKIIKTFPMIKNKKEKMKNFDKGIRDYRIASKFIKNNKTLVLKILPITTIQVVSLYSITYVIYRGFGLSEFNYKQVLLIQALSSVATTSMPLPGAMGVSEIVNKFLFRKIYPTSTVSIAVFVTRGINFYLLFVISAFIFFTTHMINIVEGVKEQNE